jgi:hypothetical protein
VVRSGLAGGPRFSEGDFQRKSNNCISMKSTLTHVCAKSAIVGWTLTESRRMWPLHNVLSFRHYFRKCFKLVHRNSGYGNFNHRYNVSPIHLHAYLAVGGLYEVCPRVRRPPVKWSAIVESLRNADLRTVSVTVCIPTADCHVLWTIVIKWFALLFHIREVWLSYLGQKARFSDWCFRGFTQSFKANAVIEHKSGHWRFLPHPLNELHCRVVNTPDSNSEGPGFKSRSGSRLSWVRFLVIFLSLSREMAGYCLKIGYHCFLPNPFQFTIPCHLFIRHCIVLVTEKASLNKL